MQRKLGSRSQTLATLFPVLLLKMNINQIIPNQDHNAFLIWYKGNVKSLKKLNY